MEDETQLTILERLRLAMFKHAALARAGARHGLEIQTVTKAPEWHGELQAARLQHGRDAGLLLVDEERRGAWMTIDVSLDWFGDADGTYPDRTGGQDTGE